MLDLNQWVLDYDGLVGLSCQAPCSLYSVLLSHGRIPDPFYGRNDRLLTDLCKKGCTFRCSFRMDPADLARDYVELRFQGLDTLCSIYLNDHLLDQVKNMHRSYTYEVKPLLRAGENTLRLEFHSPMAYFEREHRHHYLYTNDGDTLPGAAHLRKALCMSGWDWGPALPDMGIWRPVELLAYDCDRIDQVLVNQDHHDGVVDVEVTVSTRHHRAGGLFATLDGQRVPLEDGRAVIRVEQPRLWWVRGYGDQPLYGLDVALYDRGSLLDTAHRDLGLRTLTLSTDRDPDGSGSEFCFVCNGVKLFSMGANYIPADSLVTRITPDREEQLIRAALDANFNTLRVWGGGHYPDDYFFHLCDKYGLLVWLDFMVACANVWMTPEFETQCTLEAAEQLQRLQYHPCLGLLCGNNEMELAVLTWGIGESQLVREDYLKLYERLLPELAHTYAPDISYWPSSPSSGGGFDNPGDFNRGDTHYWDVWHGGIPFTDYRKHSFRFCSEYGFESFPSMKTIRSFCGPEDQNCFSRVMEDHQKCKGGNGKILRYLADNYLYPTSFEALVYASQLLQAQAIQYGVEHFRRQRGRCMGSIYWQFNDCWPVASWSSVDYYGRYKALHYAAKKFYAPVALGLFLEGNTLTVNVSNETRSPFRGRVVLGLCRKDFSPLDQTRQEIAVPALSSRDVLIRDLQPEDPCENYVYVTLLDEHGAEIMTRTCLFVPAKHFAWEKPTVTVEAADADGGVRLTVRADRFCQGVSLDFTDFDCVLSDNFFALPTAAPRALFARTDRTAAELQQALRIQTLYDIR